MRKMVWFSLGLAAACAFCAYVSIGILMLPFAIGFFLVGIALCFFRKDGFRIPIAVLIGLGLGFGWFFGYSVLHVSPLREYDGQVTYAEILVTDYSRNYDKRLMGEGKIILNGEEYAICFYSNGTARLKPGDRVEGELRLRLTTKGALEEATYHQGNGIFLLGYFQDEVTVTPASQISGRYWAQKLRQGILEKLENVFPGDTQAFARALLLGDTTKLTYEQDSAFQISGIRHIIAVSGLHVSILFALVYALAARKRLSTALLGIPALFLFAAISGFTPSVVRACIMQGLVILALLFNKEYDPPTALATAVVTLLAINPLTITSVSFQLSVGCMIGIFLFSHPIYAAVLGGRLSKHAKKKGLLGKALRWMGASVSLTLSSMAFTAPLCAFYFGMVSIVGVLSNLVLLWMVSIVFYGIMLACLLGSFWLAGGCFVAAVISWPMRIVQWAARLLSGFPLAAVYTDSVYVIAWLAFTYILLLIFLFARHKKPLLLVSCIVCSLIISVGFSWMEPKVFGYKVTVIDVGQGQSVLLQSNGKYYLVDCGGPSPVRTANTVSSLLLSRGIFRLDGLIITHYDYDHVNAAQNLLKRIPADTLYLPDVADDSGYRLALTQDYQARIRWVQTPVKLQESDHTLSIFPGVPGETGNQSSLCILFQRENCDILITGDRSTVGEAYLMEQTELPQLELLIAGHHGSKSSTGLGLVAATRPKAVAISVGEDNTYHLPDNEMLGLLDMFHCRVYRTDLQGTIDYRG